MADDELDLDAMLDSALDEGFAESAAGAQEGGDEGGEIDLDAMLDEAMVASALDGGGDAAAEKSRYAVVPCHRVQSVCCAGTIAGRRDCEQQSHSQSRVLPPPGTPIPLCRLGRIGASTTNAMPRTRKLAHNYRAMPVVLWSRIEVIFCYAQKTCTHSRTRKASDPHRHRSPHRNPHLLFD